MNLEDGPQASNSLGRPISLDDSFVDYIMFSPDGTGSIYVTLGKVTWSTKAEAECPSDVIDPNWVNGPTDPDDSGAFPQWTEVYSNPD